MTHVNTSATGNNKQYQHFGAAKEAQVSDDRITSWKLQRNQ